MTIVQGCVSCSFVAAAGKSTLTGFATAYNRWAPYVAEASQRFGVPAHWIRAVMQQESIGGKGAVSPKGAMGLMQVMPETYAELRLRYRLDADPYEPRNNILAGAAYLREMYDRFGPDGFLAAYNAGPGRYKGYLKSGRPLPEETRNYVTTLAPVIGVPGVPHHSNGTSTASQLTISGAAHDGGEHLRAPSKSKLNLGISQFDGRQNARTMTLFAIVQAVFEPTSASTQTIDMTALAPAPSHALITTSAAAESLRIRTSTAPRSSLAPSSDALFAGRSTHKQVRYGMNTQRALSQHRAHLSVPRLGTTRREGLVPPVIGASASSGGGRARPPLRRRPKRALVLIELRMSNNAGARAWNS